MKFRIATFNLENLFARFDFSAFDDRSLWRGVPPVVGLFEERGVGDQSAFAEWRRLLTAATIAQDDDKRQLSALALSKAQADIVCLQEVDDITALRRFRDHYLHKTAELRYHNLVLHEGNDRRGIDVAVMAKKEFPLYSRSHASMTFGELRKDDGLQSLLERFPEPKLGELKGRVFRRDCLEVEFRKDRHCVTIYVCHFKSMYGGAKTVPVRRAEALAVRRLIESKYENPASANWLIVGDLNDYDSYVHVDSEGHGTFKNVKRSCGIDPLLEGEFAVNVVSRRRLDKDRWTHYYGTKRRKTQLDYILASPRLVEQLVGSPEIIRNGQPHRVPLNPAVCRFPRVGWARPKASDHCPVVAEFDLCGGSAESQV